MAYGLLPSLSPPVSISSSKQTLRKTKNLSQDRRPLPAHKQFPDYCRVTQCHPAQLFLTEKAAWAWSLRYTLNRKSALACRTPIILAGLGSMCSRGSGKKGVAARILRVGRGPEPDMQPAKRCSGHQILFLCSAYGASGLLVRPAPCRMASQSFEITNKYEHTYTGLSLSRTKFAVRRHGPRSVRAIPCCPPYL